MRERSIKRNSSRQDCKRCSVKKVFLEISQNSQESSCAKVSFFNKFLKRDSNTGVFLLNFVRNFYKHIFSILLHLVEHLWLRETVVSNVIGTCYDVVVY